MNNSKNIYRELLVAVLYEHNVKSIENLSETERFFDRIETNGDGIISVYRHHLSEPLDNIYMDYTLDMARCISYIEDEIYAAKRNGKSQHGYVIEFNN